ncbi:MAG: AIR synthase-related protein [Bacteroidota bacterium]
MSDNYKYDLRGVSATKDEVHQAIKHLDKGLYPNAFCKILPDIVGGDEAYCNLMHADTAGTKTSAAYLYWKETGDLNVWKGIAQDALVMNLDDMACVGCVDHIVLSSTIGRNKLLIDGEVISTLINAANDFLNLLGEHGINVKLAGGETADVGDVVRTLDVGYTTFARMKRSEVIENQIQAGDVVVGLASFGQASYEQSYNSGIGSNGLTSARHDVLNFDYAEQYPESFDPNLPDEVTYVGLKKLTDSIPADAIPGVTGLNVGQLLLSPTRTYLPVLKKLLATHRSAIHGIIHCSGGAQTKVLKFLHNKRVIKDQLFATPYLFQLIQEQSGTTWKEMYQVFNMGHRLEVYLPESEANAVIEAAASFNIDAQIIGRVEDWEGEQVDIRSPYGVFTYQ